MDLDDPSFFSRIASFFTWGQSAQSGANSNTQQDQKRKSASDHSDGPALKKLALDSSVSVALQDPTQILLAAEVPLDKAKELLGLLSDMSITKENIIVITNMIKNLPKNQVQELIKKDVFQAALRFAELCGLAPLTPLKQCLMLAGFPLNSINAIPPAEFVYPAQAFARLLGSVNHVDINQNVPNEGLKNANGNDCFLSSVFQVISQLSPLMDMLEQKYRAGTTTPLQNEFLAFVSSLRGIPLIIYNPKVNATAVMRSFLIQPINGSSTIDQAMAKGHQDAQQFFSALLDALIRQNGELTNIFKIDLASKITLPSDVHNGLKGQDKSVRKTKETHDSSFLLSLEISGTSLDSCLNKFFELEKGVEIAEWTCLGQDIKLKANLGLNENVRGTKKLSICQPLPPILTIHLKRFEFNMFTLARNKVDSPITFPLVLDLKKCVKSRTKPLNYNLVGMIVHSGNLNDGHYWAYAKDRFSGKWYLFNDANRFEVDEVIVEEIGKAGNEMQEIINAIAPQATSVGTPYMLFYEKID